MSAAGSEAVPHALAAQFLIDARDSVIAIDKIQPVAMALSWAGENLGLISWGDRRDPPPEWTWPNRRVAVGPSFVVVQDLPDGRPVGLRMTGGGLVIIENPDGTGLTWRYPKLFGNSPVNVDRWKFVNERTADRWRALVELSQHTLNLGSGSIVAQVASKDSALLAVRRAPVRPWVFRPAHELLKLSLEPLGIASASIPSVDIASRCWEPLYCEPEKFDDYLVWSEHLSKMIARYGGQDVMLSSDGPSVDISFIRNGKRHVLHDEPLDELGRPVGLRFWGTGVDDWAEFLRSESDFVTRE